MRRDPLSGTSSPKASPCTLVLEPGKVLDHRMPVRLVRGSLPSSSTIRLNSIFVALPDAPFLAINVARMERTLFLCKPDCMEKNLAGEVLTRFERAGLRLIAAKMMRLTPPLLTEHYAHLKDRPFFPEIVTFMSSHPVLALILQGDNAVARVRELLGPTDSKKAAKGTIRGDWGADNMRNIAHASDSSENAELEVRRFFRTEEIPI